MKKSIYLVLLIVLLIGYGSCTTRKYQEHFNRYKGNSYSKVEIETIVEDSTLNVRALELIGDSASFSYLTSNGEVGIVTLDQFGNFVSIKSDVINDSIIKLNFRSLAITSKKAFGMSIGSPALLYQLDVDLEKNKLVYQENHPKAFYDSMEFWNDQEGIAIGDPTDSCMSIIITRDGGNTWNKLPCNMLPKAIEGEAAFAASDTNIAIVGNKTWVATGGKASRILFSPDKGKTWQVFNTPIVQGIETTGMYSLDFYDDKNGFAIGGDYTKAADSSANKIRTQDGGKTWQLVAQNQSPGYRSCVQYIPGKNAQELVAIGFKGIDYSSNAGKHWKHLSNEGFYTLRFVNDSVAYAAGNNRIAKLTFR